MDFQPFKQVQRLWIDAEGIPENLHRVVAFRRHFSLSEPLPELTFCVAADSDFIVTLDGRELTRGQYPDDPSVKTFDTVTLPGLAAGPHVLAILVYYCGGEFSGYTPGLPGLYFDWNVTPVQDDGWRVRDLDAFRRGAMPQVSPQLGFTMEYDLRKAWDLAAMDLSDEDWPPALTLPAAPALTFRPRPAGTKCRLGDFRPMKCVKSGRLVRFAGSAERTAAQQMASDNCFADDAPQGFPVRWEIPGGCSFSGLFLIADLGGEETGFIELDVEAAAGTRIDVAHGEHLADGRVRAEICGRNFADTVICGGGRCRFMLPFRRVGARFVELHITGQEYAPVTVHAVGIRPWRLPLPEAAALECSDAQWMELCRRAVHTLELCMHEHYEDCPWREQAMYTYDSRTQILYGYRLWGNYDFARAALELFRFALRPDKLLYLCVPSRLRTTIPVYSLVWLAELYEYYLHTGDLSLFRDCRESAEIMLNARLTEQDEATGLYRTDDDLWNFYEWTPGLNGRMDRQAEFHALYNLYLVEALDCFAKLREACGENADDERRRAGALRKAVEQHFFDASRGIYASYSDRAGVFGYHDHTQVQMLTTGAAPEAKRAALYQVLKSHTLIPMTLSPLPYEVWALEAGGQDEKQAIAPMVMKHYQSMLAAGGDTLWETELGQADFFYAGSLCHGWSALPIYVLSAVVLGVRPLSPGFTRFQVAPVPGTMQYASGEIPTPSGRIRVAWRVQENAGTLTVTAPPGLTAEVDTSSFPVPVKVEIGQSGGGDAGDRSL